MQLQNLENPGYRHTQSIGLVVIMAYFRPCPVGAPTQLPSLEDHARSDVMKLKELERV